MGSGEFAAAVGGAVDPMSLLRRVADRTLGLVPAAQGVAIGLVDEEGLRYVCGTGAGVSGVGTRADLSASLSGLAVETGRVVRSNDTQRDPRVDAAMYRRLSVRSLVCVPLSRSHEMFGVLAVNAAHPHAFTDADVAVLTRLADLVNSVVGSACDLHRANNLLGELGQPNDAVDAATQRCDPSDQVKRPYGTTRLTADAIARVDAGQRVKKVLDDPGLMSLAFQPILDLSSGSVIAVEALARFNITPVRPPDMWFADAHEAGLGVEVEMLAVTKALEHQALLPDGVAVTINVSPETIVSAELSHALLGVGASGVVLELTENTAFERYAELTASLLALRKAGVRIAVDDAGSGSSRPTRMLELAPHFIKVDRELICDIDLDPVRRALVTSLVAFAANTGAQVLAEGVETEDELETVRALGVRYAQGYYLGRPAPLDVLEVDRAVPIAPLSGAGPARRTPRRAER